MRFGPPPKSFIRWDMKSDGERLWEVTTYGSFREFKNWMAFISSCILIFKFISASVRKHFPNLIREGTK